jgi:hypothetical protein
VQREQDLPPVRFDETQAAARLGAHIGQLDAALVGYVGRDTNAIFVPELVFVGGDELFRLVMHDQYPRLRAGGVTATLPWQEELLLRFESVYFNSPDRNRDDFLHTVVGIEYGFADWRLFVNYLHDDQTIAAHEAVTDKGERRFFRSFLFGDVRYDGGGNLRASLRGGYDLTKQFLILQPEIAYRVWRQVDVVLVADIIEADPFSYFYDVRQEDRLGVRFEYHF